MTKKNFEKKLQRQVCNARLLRLADILDTVPVERFNMSIICVTNGSGCMTEGCAAGWAMTDPTLSPLLRYANGSTNTERLRATFGLDKKQVEKIFKFGTYFRFGVKSKTTPRQKATEIRKMVVEELS